MSISVEIVSFCNYNATMFSITVRNIPEELLEKLKTLASIERRSLNSEILYILEQGTSRVYEERMRRRIPISRSTQVEIWKRLLGAWTDSRSAKEIIRGIYAGRTGGREVEL